MKNFMLPLFFVMFAMFSVAPVPSMMARAGDDSERKEVERELFVMGLKKCVEEVYPVGNGYYEGEDEGLLEACLAGKGVSLNAGYVKIPEDPRAYRMGAAKKTQNLPKSLTYEIGDMEAFVENLNGGRKSQPETGQNSLLEEPPVIQKPSSIQNKYYLPSDRKKDGPKPIFLNR